MEFMLLFNERTDAPADEAMAAMTRYAGELRDRGVLRRGAPLAPAADAVGVRVRDGKAMVIDGPFPETKEVVGGFCIIDVPDRDAAVQIARHCPHLQHGPIEVHAMRQRYAFPDSGKGTAFLLAFRMEPGLSDPDGSKLQRMLDFCQQLDCDGLIIDTAPLSGEPAAARLESKAGTVMITDGPFAETKDAIGGYALIRAGGRAQAVELAQQFPHATWGPVEVREVLFFDPV